MREKKKKGKIKRDDFIFLRDLKKKKIQMGIVVLIFGFLLKWTLNFRILKN